VCYVVRCHLRPPPPPDSLYSLKINTKIENLATCDVQSVIRFLNAEYFRPAEIHRLIVEPCGEGVIKEGNVSVVQRGRTNAHGEE
jgi:hypothetical protein